MTAIQLLTKEPPAEVFRDDRDRVILSESKIAPLWLIDILNKMVRSDFKKRYQSVEEVLKDLGQRNPPEPVENATANSLGITKNHLNHQQTANLSSRNHLKIW